MFETESTFLVVRTVLCMVMVAESAHFDRLTNLVRYRRERSPTDVCKKRKHGVVYNSGMGTGGYCYCAPSTLGK